MVITETDRITGRKVAMEVTVTVQIVNIQKQPVPTFSNVRQVKEGGVNHLAEAVLVVQLADLEQVVVDLEVAVLVNNFSF